MIQIKPFGPERLEEILLLYEKEGWRAYLGNEPKLKAAFERSLLCLGAFDESGRLLGFARCVGDGEHIVVLQDLMTDQAFRGQGIGTALVKAVMERFADVRMLQVNTDLQDEPVNRFYRSLGMKELREGGMISYFR